MTFVSAFSGIEGFGLAFERAGMTCVAQIEIDKYCQGILRSHFPQTKLFSDITTVHGDDIGPVDLLCGGFPCQDVSVAGKRAGLAGKRTRLFFEAARLINEIKPTWIILENVPGLLSSNGGRDMGTVLGTLDELGYGFAYRVLDAQYFGVPQRRRRVFIIGRLGDWDGPREVLFEPESLRGDSSPRGEARADVARTLTAGTSASRGVNPPGRRNEDDYNLVVSTLQGGGKRGYRIDAESAAGGHLVARTLTTSNARLDGDTETFVCVTPIAFRVATRPHSATEAERWEATDLTNTLNGWNERHDPPDTVTILPAVRRLTPRECERLQGFPDDWTAEQSDAQRYRQLGNAVAVPVAEWIGRRFIAVHRQREIAA